MSLDADATVAAAFAVPSRPARVLTVPAATGGVLTANGLDCEAGCTMPDGSSVVLKAVAEAGFYVDGWSGPCTTTAETCTFTITGDTTATATLYTNPALTIDVSERASPRTATGTITSSGDLSGATVATDDWEFVGTPVATDTAITISVGVPAGLQPPATDDQGGPFVGVTCRLSDMTASSSSPWRGRRLPRPAHGLEGRRVRRQRPALPDPDPLGKHDLLPGATTSSRGSGRAARRPRTTSRRRYACRCCVLRSEHDEPTPAPARYADLGSNDMFSSRPSSMTRQVLSGNLVGARRP